jgi:hypothetical protein
MKTTSSMSIGLVLAAMLFVFLLPVDGLIAEEANSPTSVLQDAGKTDAGDTPKTIQWRNLAPENGRPFTDPFAKLTGDQRSDLSYVVRVQRLIAEEKIEADGDDAIEAARLARKLKLEGVDIGWLMAQRRHVTKIRGLQVEELSKSIAESLGDKKVTLTGFVIPITVRQERLTEFFLVPTSNACSNEAAPSPLQVVFVSTEPGVDRPEKRIPVRVTGRVKAQTTTQTIRNGIAVTTVQAAYTMLSPEFERFIPIQASRELIEEVSPKSKSKP